MLRVWNLRTGSKTTFRDFSPPAFSVATADTMYFVNSRRDRLLSVDSRTSQTNWSVKLSGVPSYIGGPEDDSAVVVTFANRAEVRDPKDGTLVYVVPGRSLEAFAVRREIWSLANEQSAELRSGLRQKPQVELAFGSLGLDLSRDGRRIFGVIENTFFVADSQSGRLLLRLKTPYRCQGTIFVTSNHSVLVGQSYQGILRLDSSEIEDTVKITLGGN